MLSCVLYLPSTLFLLSLSSALFFTWNLMSIAVYFFTSSLTLILWQKTNRSVVYRGLYSYLQRVRVITRFPNTFSYCFCMLSGEFAKVFERKVWRVQVAQLHNAARALSSRCFQLSTNLDKDFCRYLWYCGSKRNRISFSVALVKFHLFGINWHVFMQKLSFIYYSENRATSRIWKVLPNMVFPPDLGGKSGGVLSIRMQVIRDSLFRQSRSQSPRAFLVSTKTRSFGIINKLVPRALVSFAFEIWYCCAFKANFQLP